MIGLKIARRGYAGPINGADIARHGYTTRSVWEQVIGAILNLFRPAIKSFKPTYQIRSQKPVYQIKSLKKRVQIKWLQ